MDSRVNIVSDEIGNPVDIGGTLLEWNGRQLQKIALDENNFIQYAYNTDGQRVKKILSMPDNGWDYTYEYYYNGSILAGQKVTKTENGETTEYILAFMYDNNGDVFGFLYNGEPYYYVKNAQNDVILITDADGQTVVLYQYDAWGKITQYFDGTEEEIGLINPLFYRSYYMDVEMEMYYLNSRYYMPTFHRFLNADGLIGANQDIHAYNLFAYCSNNPVNFCDPTGESLLGALGVALGALAPWFIAMVAIAVVGTIAITVVGTPAINDGIATGIGNAIGAIEDTVRKVKERVKEKVEAKEATIAIPKDKKPKEPVVFPVNPLEFNPVGLNPVLREGTKNGSFISWMDPITNIEIFRWDENPNYENGPHYHAIGYSKRYFEPGKSEVPYELAEIYFPR